MESHDYRIYYVNIDLRHQHGTSAAESQTSLSGDERGETSAFRRLTNFMSEKYTYKHALISTLSQLQGRFYNTFHFIIIVIYLFIYLFIMIFCSVQGMNA